MSAFTKAVLTEKLKEQYPLAGNSLEDVIRYAKVRIGVFDSDIARGFQITAWQREAMQIYATELRRRNVEANLANEIETRLATLKPE